ncbi:hypothetical protein MLD38_030910 [Melastoma candidum]|uniref:Uncharacterized protein n=1 Tax=Melastoma candidum TaxID=119954 RepID=A0ACB9MMZ5_9MYRT|nr:hypothetical protein MLD38_030910 [Melastoma candidum]
MTWQHDMNKRRIRRAIRAIPMRVYSPTSDSAMPDCSICLDGFEEGEEFRILPACRHPFHRVCIDPWLELSGSCPSCRAAVVPMR